MRADINLTPEADISEVMGAAGHPQKSTQIYQHIYDNYWGAGQSVYAMAA